MKIKKNSWMVWMIEQAFETTPKSLCTFFWLLVGSIVLMPLAYPIFFYNIYVDKIRKDCWSTLHYGVGVLLNVLGIFLSSQYFAHYYLRKELTPAIVFGWSPVFLVLLCLAISILAWFILALINIIFKIERYYQNKRASKEYENKKIMVVHATNKKKKPNVIIEYIKAKKQKVCPIIEYED